MSRSGYSEEFDDQWPLIRWRGQVASAIKGKRGQAFLREMLSALDAMPEKRLIAHELRQGGEVCALGSVGAQRGIELESLDPEYPEGLAAVFGIAHQLVQEIEYVNDEEGWDKTPEDRWQRVRSWVAASIRVGDAKLSSSAEPNAVPGTTP